MAPLDKDASVLSHIQRLVAEEHRLFESAELAPEQSKLRGVLKMGDSWVQLRLGSPATSPD